MFEGGYPGEPPYGQPQPEAEAPVPPSIPWQCKERYPSVLAAMWETIKVVLLHPSRAFANMRVENSLAQSLLYTLILGSVCGIIGDALQSAVPTPFAGAAPFRQAPPIGFGSGRTGVALFIVLVPVIVVVGTFIVSGITHLALIIVNGANKGFEATFSVMAYCGGSAAIFGLIPFCGSWVMGVWSIVVEIIGLARAHQTSMGKAALAVFMPIIAALFCCVTLFAIGAGLARFGASIAH
jgi:hypothetical protein